MKTWLTIDLVVLLPDWVFKILDSGGSAEHSLGFLRVVRLMRLMRLLRVGRLRVILQKLYELMDSDEYISIFLDVASMICLMIFLTHFICCLWYHIAITSDGPTWMDRFRNQSEWYTYLTAFHWGITQFTPASMDVNPQNTLERVYAITVVVFALVFFSYVVGSISGSMAQLRSLSGEFHRQFWVLRRYLKTNRVPTLLASRVKSYLEHAWLTQKARVTSSKVEILKMLSDQLQAELHTACAIPHLNIHPFFWHLLCCSPVTARRLCMSGIKWRSLARCDTLFLGSERAEGMYIVVHGELRYRRLCAAGKEVFQEMVEAAEDWISEPALWLKLWVHLGSLTSSVETELCAVGADTLPGIIKLNPVASRACWHYVQNFFEWIQQLPYDEMSDISQGEDVCLTLASWCDPSIEPPRVVGHQLSRKTTVLEKAKNTLSRLSVLSSKPGSARPSTRSSRTSKVTTGPSQESTDSWVA